MASGKGHIKGGILFFLIFIYTILTYFTPPTLIDASIYFVLFKLLLLRVLTEDLREESKNLI